MGYGELVRKTVTGEIAVKGNHREVLKMRKGNLQGTQKGHKDK